MSPEQLWKCRYVLIALRYRYIYMMLSQGRCIYSITVYSLSSPVSLCRILAMEINPRFIVYIYFIIICIHCIWLYMLIVDPVKSNQKYVCMIFCDVSFITVCMYDILWCLLYHGVHVWYSLLSPVSRCVCMILFDVSCITVCMYDTLWCLLYHCAYVWYSLMSPVSLCVCMILFDHGVYVWYSLMSPVSLCVCMILWHIRTVSRCLVLVTEWLKQSHVQTVLIGEMNWCLNEGKAVIGMLIELAPGFLWWRVVFWCSSWHRDVLSPCWTLCLVRTVALPDGEWITSWYTWFRCRIHFRLYIFQDEIRHWSSLACPLDTGGAMVTLLVSWPWAPQGTPPLYTIVCLQSLN